MKTIAKLTADGYCTIRVAEIDKHDAMEMLGRNTKNRDLIKSNVDILRMSMNDGRWMFNGDSIVFDNDGYLKSGQHRLTAFASSDLDSITVLIVNMIKDDDILVTLNRGKGLTCGQYLSIRGVKNSNKAAAVAKIAMAMLDNDMINVSTVASRGVDYKIEEFIETHKDIMSKFTFSRSVRSPIAGVMAFACIANNDLTELLSKAFAMITDQDTPKGSLAYVINKVNGMSIGHTSANNVVDSIRKTMAAIANFIETGKAPEKLYGIDKDIFLKKIAKFHNDVIH